MVMDRPSRSSSEDFNELLQDPVRIQRFALFLAKEHSCENLIFWLKCEQLKYTDKHQKRREHLLNIWYVHLAPECPYPVNLDAPALNRIKHIIRSEFVSKQCLLEAQDKIFKLMMLDSFIRYKFSKDSGREGRSKRRQLPNLLRHNSKPSGLNLLRHNSKPSGLNLLTPEYIPCLLHQILKHVPEEATFNQAFFPLAVSHSDTIHTKSMGITRFFSSLEKIMPKQRSRSRNHSEQFNKPQHRYMRRASTVSCLI